jgi:hypothetical protein
LAKPVPHLRRTALDIAP